MDIDSFGHALVRCDDSSSFSMSSPSSLFSRWNAPIAIALRIALALGWSLLVAVYYRGQHFGLDVGILQRSVLLVSLFAAPLTWLALLGFRWRLQLVGLVLISAAALVLAEGVAGLEEARFMRQHAGATEPVFQGRWWPFQGNHLGYRPEGHWFAGC